MTAGIETQRGPFKAARLLWADLRSGRAGWPVRMGLSLASATALLGALMLIFGIAENVTSTYIRDSHAALGLSLAGAVWCVSLWVLWTGYRRWARVLKTVFLIIGIWVLTIPAAMLFESVVRREEFLIAGVIIVAIAVTIYVITTSVYQGLGGRPLVSEDGTIRVNCPSCGYSMVGLSGSTCPECGATYTIDQLIRAQDYEALRPRPLLPSSLRLFPSSRHDEATPSDVPDDAETDRSAG